jgi:hypothetical protein
VVCGEVGGAVDTIYNDNTNTGELPESIIFEVLAANPDELKKKELMEHIENKYNPLPDYIIETMTATGTQGQKMWDTRGLEPGTYYYTLMKSGEYKSGRIVIHR